MPDMATIASMLSSIKFATDLAKILREADRSFATAEWKMKLADLSTTLADLRFATAEIKETLIQKEERIAELEEALLIKERVLKFRDTYYEVGENGEPVGDPYCLNCWESFHYLRHLITIPNTTTRECPVCKTKYSGNNVYYRR
ncbi:MAG: hypothetical protein AAGU21_22020 [Solidesulfovibrio sp.]|uniref:hypothetical protein n=1 Tax=Solidesulfovibrio sp. TaxID=2910990 RepID=UPI0031588F71